MLPRSSLLRGAALLAAGSLLVHEARYAVGYGRNVGDALAGPSHGSLGWLAPLAALAVALVCGVAVARLAVRPRRDGSRPTPRLWLLTAGSLTLIFVLQETLEGLLTASHPGLSETFADGGWAALLFAIAVGAAIALALRGARAVRAAAASLFRTRIFRVSSGLVDFMRPAAASHRPAAALSRNLAGRGPPLPL